MPILARSPVIALTGRWMPEYRYRHAYQEIDHWPLFQPVTKFSALVDGAKQLPLLLRQAFRQAVSGSTAPVHLDLLGIAAELIEEDEVESDVIVDSSFQAYPAFRPAPDDDKIRAAAELLEQAQRPVLLAGGGVTASQAGPEVTALAEKLSMPVVTSLNGKGSIPEDHPLSVGVLGTYSRSCANQVAYEADLVLIVGSQTGGQATHFWRVPKAGRSDDSDQRRSHRARPQLPQPGRHPGRRQAGTAATHRRHQARCQSETEVVSARPESRVGMARRPATPPRLRRQPHPPRAPLP